MAANAILFMGTSPADRLKPALLRGWSDGGTPVPSAV